MTGWMNFGRWSHRWLRPSSDLCLKHWQSPYVGSQGYFEIPGGVRLFSVRRRKAASHQRVGKKQLSVAQKTDDAVEAPVAESHAKGQKKVSNIDSAGGESSSDTQADRSSDAILNPAKKKGRGPVKKTNVSSTRSSSFENKIRPFHNTEALVFDDVTDSNPKSRRKGEEMNDASTLGNQIRLPREHFLDRRSTGVSISKQILKVIDLLKSDTIEPTLVEPAGSRLYLEVAEMQNGNMTQSNSFTKAESELLMDLLRLLSEILQSQQQGSVKSNANKTKRLSADVFDVVTEMVKRFPFFALFSHHVRSFDFLYAHELLDIMTLHLVGKFSVSGFQEECTLMLRVVVDEGSRPPYPEDTISLTLKLMDTIIAGKSDDPGFRRVGGVTTLIFDLVSKLLIRQFEKRGNEDNARYVIDLFGRMRRYGANPSVYSWNALLLAHGHLGDMDNMFKTLGTLQRQRFPPAQILCNGIVESCLMCGNVDLAEQVFLSMQHRVPWVPGVFYHPDKSSLSSNAEKSITPNGGIPVPTTGSSSRLVQNVLRWPSPTISTYNSMIQGYGARGDIERVCSLYKDMKKSSIGANIATANILTDALGDNPLSIEVMLSYRPEFMPPFDVFFRGRDLTQVNLFSPPVQNQNFSFTNVLDMHGLSRSQAKISLLAYMEAIGAGILEQDRQRLAKGLDPLYTISTLYDDDNVFKVITGRGSMTDKSRRGPLLRQMVEKSLDDMNIPNYVPPNNNGVVFILLKNLRELARLKEKERNERNPTMSITTKVTIGAAVLGSVASVSSFLGLP